jgi:hypothetical protein
VKRWRKASDPPDGNDINALKERYKFQFIIDIKDSFFSNQIVVLKARGIRFEIMLKQMDSIPNSRLAKIKEFLELLSQNRTSAMDYFRLNQLCDDYNEITHEFLFNKDPEILNIVISFYSINLKAENIHLSLEKFCANSLDEELTNYWLIADYETRLAPCCLIGLHHEMEHKRYRKQEHDSILKEFYNVDDFGNYCLPKLREKIWDIVENPKSSLCAKVKIFKDFMFMILFFRLIN